MKYANYNKTNGKLLGWYDDEIHKTIPIPNIKVSEKDWQIAIDNNYNFIAKKGLSFKDFRTVTEVQQAKLSEIKTAYEQANQEDIAYLGTTFQADKYSQNLIVSVLSAGAVPDGFFWMDKANNQVAMTYVELQGLSGAILARGQINYIKLQELKAQANKAVTQTKLDTTIW